MENDEVYVPKSRSDLGIPPPAESAPDFEDYFGDTPLYTLFTLIRQQLLAFPAYLRKHRILISLCDICAHSIISVQCLRPEGLSQGHEPLQS